MVDILQNVDGMVWEGFLSSMQRFSHSASLFDNTGSSSRVINAWTSTLQMEPSFVKLSKGVADRSWCVVLSLWSEGFGICHKCLPSDFNHAAVSLLANHSECLCLLSSQVYLVCVADGIHFLGTPLGHDMVKCCRKEECYNFFPSSPWIFQLRTLPSSECIDDRAICMHSALQDSWLMKVFLSHLFPRGGDFLILCYCHLDCWCKGFAASKAGLVPFLGIRARLLRSPFFLPNSPAWRAMKSM